MEVSELSLSGGQEPSSKGQQIVLSLRRQIVTGDLPPGTRLPTRSELESIFEASPVTVQRAFDALIRDQFVEVIGKRTYVSEHPPHLTRYALLFMGNPTAQRIRFYYALHQAALALDDDQRRKLPIYCDANPFRGSSFQQLCEDVESHRVAGLIFSTSPAFYVNTPVLHEPGIPRVSIAAAPEVPGLPIVNLDRDGFVRRSLEILVTRGRRRIAVFDNYELDMSVWERAFADFGLPFHPHWIQQVPIEYPASIKGCLRLMMHASRTDLPDGLILGDDNLVSSATAALLGCGVQVPQELDVVAHCNFPSVPECHVPVHWLGFDIPGMLQKCVELVDAQRRSEPVALISVLPALTAGEVPRPGRLLA